MTYDLRKLAAWGIGLTWGAWMMEFVNVIQSWRLVGFLNRLAATNDFDMAQATRIDQMSALLAYSFVACLIAAYIVNGIWIYRAASTAQTLAPTDKRMKAGWAIGWYFIPIASLWLPYGGMRHTWNTSQGHGTDIEAQLPSWFPLWWGTWIVVNIIDQVSARAWNSLESGIESFAATLDTASLVIGVITTFLFVRILRQTTDGLHKQIEAI